MIPSDIQSVLLWWLTILILGTGFLPLTFLVFNKFFDRGYIFSKIFGLAFTTYAIFLLGVIRITKFSQPASIIIFIILAIISWAAFRPKSIKQSILKAHWKIIIFEEVVFLASLFFWAYIHSFNPDIHGLEKYMDYGFINSILRSDFFPPKDMWFTPYSINYYYFGHLVTAVLTKLSGIPAKITFNLMLSTIFAFCLSETFSLGANLYVFLQKSKKISMFKSIMVGLLTAILTTFAGNLHILYAFFKPYPAENPVPPWQLPFLLSSFPNAYWYPNATRFIDHTIHEFPIYSWVVADLHGHVLDIPFVLLIIAVLLALFMSKSEARNPKPEINSNLQKFKFKTISNFDIRISNLLLIGFLLAVMYMTNAWDGGIYLLLTGLTLLATYYKKIKTLLLSIVIVIVSLFIFSYPYNHFFKPFASGIGILCAPSFLTKMGKIGPFLFEVNHCQHSYWWQLLILYGFFYFFVLSFAIFTTFTKKLLKADVFVFLLIILSTVLIILPEFIYLKDIYPAHYRANTMFKLVFQSFIMLSISTGYIFVRLISKIKDQRSKLFNLYSLFLIFAFSFLILVMTYPVLAIKSYYGDLKTLKSLDGTAYLKSLYSADFEAINWMNTNITGQPVILEAQSDSYTDYARISSNTGLPTVLGWTVHEWLWRGTYDIPAPRISEIKTIYETPDLETAKKMLEKYDVKYVFIGSLEYQKYPQLSEPKFQKLGKLVYQNQNAKIYKISL